MTRAKSTPAPAPYIIDDHYAPRVAHPDAATEVPQERVAMPWVQRATRYGWEASVDLESGLRLVVANVVDISVTGMYVHAEELLDVDKACEVALPLPGGLPARVTARVVWTRAEPAAQRGMGLHFEQMPPDIRARLDGLIAELSGGEPDDEGGLSYGMPNFSLVDDPPPSEE